MNGDELLRIIDAIHRDKDIDKEVLFESIETALATAARKRYGASEDLTVKIDRESGEIVAFIDEEPADFIDLGRIAAQTAKQVIIQRIRDAEQDVIQRDFEHKVGQLVNGSVQRIEAGNVIVNLGKAEGILPRSEKVRAENYHPGDRIKALIIEVKKVGTKVRIILSRAHPDLVRKLFELEVPEVADRIIEIKRVAREPGYRTKIAVSSYDSRVDAIGACVGIRGTRIKSITDELNGEKIDIIRWNDSNEVLIMNSLAPAQVSQIVLHEDTRVAEVTVPDDQLSLGIGRKGQNVRLASKLTGWDIKIASQNPQPLGGAAGDVDSEALRAAKAALGVGDPLPPASDAAPEDSPGQEETAGNQGAGEAADAGASEAAGQDAPEATEGAQPEGTDPEASG